MRISGLNEVVRGLQKAGVEVADLKAAFKAISSEGAAIAAALAPKRTGRLAGNIRGSTAKNKAVITAGGARVPYAAVVNYGWPARNIGASGFMQAADMRLRPTAVRDIEQALNSALARVGLT